MSEFNEEDLLASLRSMLGPKGKGINILEEQISLNVQLEYFELLARLKKEGRIELIQEDIDLLSSEECTEEEFKEILVKLSLSDEVSSFRMLESLTSVERNADNEMARLALQQSKMLIQGSLLNESQIMISTGLGGKADKLRYFAAFFTADGSPFSESQQAVLEKEIDFFFERNNCIKETVEFGEDVSTLVCLIPLGASVKDIFKPIIEESNSLGEFIAKHFIVTNIKRMTIEEVKEFANKRKEDDSKEIPEETAE